MSVSYVPGGSGSGGATEVTLATIAAAVKLEDSASADGDSGIVLLAQRRDTDATAVAANEIKVATSWT